MQRGLDGPFPAWMAQGLQKAPGADGCLRAEWGDVQKSSPGTEHQQPAAFSRRFVARRVALVQANSTSLESPSRSTGWDLLR